MRRKHKFIDSSAGIDIGSSIISESTYFEFIDSLREEIIHKKELKLGRNKLVDLIS